MQALPFDVDALLQPLSEDTPGGPDLEYDPRFIALEQAGAGKPERQYGDKLYPAEPPEWPALLEQALELARVTRDLRVAVWLLRSATRLHGLAGAAAGLRLLAGLLGGLWESVHPRLDPDDDNDPTMRMNTLAPLTVADAFIGDLRAATLLPLRGSLRVRDIELGLGRGDAMPDESVPTEDGIRQALQALLDRDAGVADTVSAVQKAVTDLAATLETQVGSSAAIDLGPLNRLLKPVVAAIAGLRAAAGEAVDAAAEADSADGAAPRRALGTAVATGAIASREDVARELERVCAWIERNEPTNPAPILIRRAQRLMGKNFLEIMRDLAPDGVAQIEHLAGPEGLG
jgi:type VI secretion system protein ImpA